MATAEQGRMPAGPGGQRDLSMVALGVAVAFISAALLFLASLEHQAACEPLGPEGAVNIDTIDCGGGWHGWYADLETFVPLVLAAVFAAMALAAIVHGLKRRER